MSHHKEATPLGMPLQHHANNDTDDEEAHKERMAKLEQNTNKLMADYQDFLSDMTNSPIEDLISGNNRLADDDNGDVESGDDDNNEGLATIPEDSSSSHSTIPTSNLQYYDYPDDNINIDFTYDNYTGHINWKRKRYTRYTFYQTIREVWGCLSISIIVIGLLCIIISLIWNAQQRQSTTSQQEVHQIDVYKSIQEIWDPIWYNRTTGYDGKMYEQAQNFCNNINRTLCPYSAYCPAGKNNLPSSDIKEETETWAPIYNSNNNPNNNNEWVQVGKQNTCKLYSEMRGQHWEQQQDDDKYDAYLESITRNIACCIERSIRKEEHPNDGFPTYIIDRPPVLEEDVPVTAEVEKVDVQVSNTAEVEKEKVDTAIVSNMKPTWFHRAEDDWTGTTWPEAIEYCALNQHLAVCPYRAICPQGVNKAPIEGVKYDEPKGSFAPISNGFNKWVSVSSDNTCVEKMPSWGADKGREDLTRHIVCCKIEDGGS